MKDSSVALICLIVFAAGILLGVYGISDPPGSPANSGEFSRGSHQILAVVEVEEDYALVVLRSEGKEPRYYRIEKKNVLNFEDILVATTVVKVSDNGLKYIEFKP